MVLFKKWSLVSLGNPSRIFQKLSPVKDDLMWLN